MVAEAGRNALHPYGVCGRDMTPTSILLASPEDAGELSARLTRLSYQVAGVARTPAELQALTETDSPDLILIDGSASDAMDLVAAADRLGHSRTVAVVRLTQGEAAHDAPGGLERLSAPYTDRELRMAIDGSVALARAAQEHRASAPMRVLAAIVGGIAHEYNNILTSISGNAELALFDIAPEMDARLSIDQIQASVKRAIVLTRQVLTLARRSASQPELLDMNLLVGELLPLLTIVAGKRASFTANIGPEPIYVTCAPNPLRFALIGLVIEAALAVDEGEIQIATRALPDAQRAELLIGHTPAGRPVSAAHGLTAHTDEYQEVRALGLATAYALTRAVGGAVEVDGGDGQQQSVRLLLPLTE